MVRLAMWKTWEGGEVKKMWERGGGNGGEVGE